MIEFKILPQMYHNPESTRWIYTIFKFRLRSQTLQQHDIKPTNNVRKNLFYDWLKTTTSWVGNIKFEIIQPKRLFRAVEKHAVETV
jgi:hypothetical protein